MAMIYPVHELDIRVGLGDWIRCLTFNRPSGRVTGIAAFQGAESGPSTLIGASNPASAGAKAPSV